MADEVNLKAGSPVQPAVFEVGGVAVLTLPPSWTQHPLLNLMKTAHVQAPGSISEDQVTRDNKSFCTYLKRFDHGQTLFRVQRQGAQVVADLDYHANGTSPATDTHRLRRAFSTSREFRGWKQADGKKLKQREFAEFLEDRMEHLSSAGPVSQGSLLQAVLGFKANQNSACTAISSLVNGDVEFQFTRETRVMSLELPEQLELHIPVYEFGESWIIHARLRYELKESALTFWFDLVKIEDVVDDAFAAEVDSLKGEMSLLGTVGDFILED